MPLKNPVAYKCQFTQATTVLTFWLFAAHSAVNEPIISVRTSINCWSTLILKIIIESSEKVIIIWPIAWSPPLKPLTQTNYTLKYNMEEQNWGNDSEWSLHGLDRAFDLEEQYPQILHGASYSPSMHQAKRRWVKIWKEKLLLWKEDKTWPGWGIDTMHIGGDPIWTSTFVPGFAANERLVGTRPCTKLSDGHHVRFSDFCLPKVNGLRITVLH